MIRTLFWLAVDLVLVVDTIRVVFS
jgi:hypothetical protein